MRVSMRPRAKDFWFGQIVWQDEQASAFVRTRSFLNPYLSNYLKDLFRRIAVDICDMKLSDPVGASEIFVTKLGK